MATREGDLEVEQLTDADLIEVDDGGEDERRQDEADARERESRLYALEIRDAFDRQMRDRDRSAFIDRAFLDGWDYVAGGEG